MYASDSLRNHDFISKAEFNTTISTVIKEIEMAVENKLEQIFLKLKGRIDEKAE